MYVHANRNTVTYWKANFLQSKMLTELGVLLMIILRSVVFAQGRMDGDNNVGCPSTERVVFGSQGYITCTFSIAFSEVYWYDDVSGRSGVPAIAVYRLDTNTKYGTGIDNGEYDILSNGTLVITNVTLRHEKQYKVVACPPRSNCIPSSAVSVKVTVYPSTLAPFVTSCNNGGPCVITFTKTGHLTCEFDSARPPVDLEWVKQDSGKDIQIEKQTSFSELNIDDVTYKSYAVVNDTVSNDRLLAVYSCKSKWNSTGLVTERKILVDFLEESDIINLPSEETVYYEINRRSELRCKVSNFSEMIWRKISSSGRIETIGFMFEGVIHINEGFSEDIILSTDGGLIFTSLQLHHEGIYACIYDNGRDVKGIHTSYLQILVPPSPPYIQIKECNKNRPCIFRGNRTGLLTCVIHGVRTEVSLTWIATNDKLVTLQTYRTDTQHRAQLTDLSTSVHFELVHDVVCGTPVELQCHVGHPISEIIQPYAKTVIYTDECDDLHDGEDEIPGACASSVVTIATVAAVILGIACLILYCMKYFKRHLTEDQQSAESAVEGAKQPNRTGVQTSDSKKYTDKNGHRRDKLREDHESKIQLEHNNENGVHTRGSSC